MFNSYKDVKICCYAIAASEPESFIDRWLESMSGADYIAVLVTKENDPNYKYFLSKKAQYPQLIVEQKAITPWRFDTARNESMKLIPEDSDVLICTDIDETLDERFWDDLRKCVFEHPNFDRIFYRYAWSHNDKGNPKWVFWYDKITQLRGWHWDYPVHEALKCDTKRYHYEGQYYLNSDIIYLHHYPDNTKSRGSYLGLLEKRAEEYPEDLYGLYYLAREYSFVKNWEKALITVYKLYTRIRENPVRDDMRMMPSVLCMLGDFLNKLNIKDDAEYYYRQAITAEPTFRDGYVKLAQLLAYQPRPDEVFEIIDQMKSKSKYQEDWRLVTYYWRDWKINQILGDANCWKGNYIEALNNFKLAEADIKTRDDRIDATGEGFYSDFNFLKAKLGLK